MSPFDAVFSFHDVVEPDLVFVGPDQNDILTAQDIQGTPALLIEILSPSTRTRDQDIKHRLYERNGVREYWLVDLDLNAVTVYRRSAGDAFPPVAHLTAERHDTLETPLVPGWSVPLARLFR